LLNGLANADLGGGEIVEAATVGSEGMSGISVFLGAGPPTERASVRVKGHALTMTTEAFNRAAVVAIGPLYEMMRRYAQSLFTQLARDAACNRVHTVEQRAARWLLTTADRMHSPTFELTQPFLAQKRSVRCASVSKTTRALTSGSIAYVRGTIVILDRPRLQAHACASYRVVRDITAETLSRTGESVGVTTNGRARPSYPGASS